MTYLWMRAENGTTTNKMMKWWPGHSAKHRKLLINGIKSCVFPPGNKIITFVFEFLQSLCPVGKPITIDLRQSRMMNVIPSTPTIITVNWRWNCIYSFTKGLKTGQGMKKQKTIIIELMNAMVNQLQRAVVPTLAILWHKYLVVLEKNVYKSKTSKIWNLETQTYVMKSKKLKTLAKKSR